MWKVTWSKSVEKDLPRVPDFIRQKSRAWLVAVEHDGMPAVRELKGFHNETLRGPRSGQRSMRLNRAYLVIYIEEKDGQIRIVNVIEVNKHEY